MHKSDKVPPLLLSVEYVMEEGLGLLMALVRVFIQMVMDDGQATQMYHVVHSQL